MNMSNMNFMAIFIAAVKIFQCGPKCWTSQLTNTAIHGATITTYSKNLNIIQPLTFKKINNCFTKYLQQGQQKQSVITF